MGGFNGSRKRRVYCVADDAADSIRGCVLVGTCYDGGMAVESDRRIQKQNLPT